MGHIIAISGWKQSGKDTAAELLIKEYGYVRVAFADTLKDMVAEQYGIPRRSCDDPALKEKALLQYPVSPKDAFSRMIAKCLIREFRGPDGQRPTDLVERPDGCFGLTVNPVTELITEDDLYPIYWTPRSLCILEGSVKRSANPQYWTQRSLSKLDPEGKYVITDMRYKNEAAQIANHAEKHFSQCATLVRVNRWESIDSVDSSEHDLDDFHFDATLENRGTIEEYHRLVHKMMERLR